MRRIARLTASIWCLLALTLADGVIADTTLTITTRLTNVAGYAWCAVSPTGDMDCQAAAVSSSPTAGLTPQAPTPSPSSSTALQSEALKALPKLDEMNGRFNAGGILFSCPTGAITCYVVASADRGASYLTNQPLNAFPVDATGRKTPVQQPIQPGTVKPDLTMPQGEPYCLMAYAVDASGKAFGRTDGVCIY